MRAFNLIVATGVALLISSVLTAQVAINGDGSLPNPSAMLDIKSFDRGLLIPRMPSAQRILIGGVDGLIVYDTDTKSIWYFNGSGWTNMASSGGGSSNWGTTDFANYYNTNTGSIMINGTNTGPAHLNIKAAVNGAGAFFIGEAGNTSADYLNFSIGSGGNTTSTRTANLMGKFGNGLTIGNSANAPLIFSVFSAEKMRLTSGGVGINIPNPSSKLEIGTAAGETGLVHSSGGVRLATLISNSSAFIGTTTNSPLNFFANNNTTTPSPALTVYSNGNVGVGGGTTGFQKFEVFTPDAQWGMLHTTGAGAGAIQVGTYAGSGGGWIATKTNSPLLFSTSLLNTNNFSQMILNTNGNLGIGSGFPDFRLTVNSGVVQSNGNTHLLKLAGQNPFMVFNTGAADIGYIKAWTTTAVAPFSPGMILGAMPGYPIYLSTNNYDASMMIASNGNVGIGTTNPTYKLAVNGSIRSKEVRVESGWADFVFEKDYNLMPLADVEKYIQANNHLPEIPSAKDIQTNGLAVGEVQTKMMQKIEELTLYMIEANKQIDELKKTVADLKANSKNQ